MIDLGGVVAGGVVFGDTPKNCGNFVKVLQNFTSFIDFTGYPPEKKFKDKTLYFTQLSTKIA